MCMYSCHFNKELLRCRPDMSSQLMQHIAGQGLGPAIGAPQTGGPLLPPGPKQPSTKGTRCPTTRGPTTTPTTGTDTGTSFTFKGVLRSQGNSPDSQEQSCRPPDPHLQDHGQTQFRQRRPSSCIKTFRSAGRRWYRRDSQWDSRRGLREN